MPANTFPADIVNRAIQQLGNDQPKVSGVPPNFDGSTAGIAAGIVYPSVVQTVFREYGWDFARTTNPLARSGNIAPPQWLFEYLYPTNGIEVRQLTLEAVADPNNPAPTRWTVGFSLVTGVPTKVIWSNVADALGVVTGQPPESAWDAGFTESVVRLLSSELAMAIAGRPDTSRQQLEAAGEFERAAEMRDG